MNTRIPEGPTVVDMLILFTALAAVLVLLLIANYGGAS